MSGLCRGWICSKNMLESQMLINMSCIMIFLWHRQREGGTDPTQGGLLSQIALGQMSPLLACAIVNNCAQTEKESDKASLLSHQSYASKPVLQGRAQKAARLLILPLSPRPPGMQILGWYALPWKEDCTTKLWLGKWYAGAAWISPLHVLLILNPPRDISRHSSAEMQNVLLSTINSKK